MKPPIACDGNREVRRGEPVNTYRTDAGHVTAAEEAEVEEGQEEQADADMAKLETRLSGLVSTRSFAAFQRGWVPFIRSKARLHEHPRDEGRTVDGIEQRFVREREDHENGAEREEEDAQPLEERLSAGSAVCEGD